MPTQFSKFRFGNLRVTLSRSDDDANWQFCCYIASEKKQYRQSTKTAILDEAKNEAQNIVVDILSKQRSGQKVFSITVANARKEFLLDLDKRVKLEAISERTGSNTSRHIDWGLKFLNAFHISANAALDTIKAEIWKQYPEWRLKLKPSLKRTVIHQELVSIRAMFKHAKELGHITEANIPKWDLETERVRRRRITQKDVQESLKAVAKWAKEDRRRQMFETVLQVMLVTGMRTGEVLTLKRSDIEATRKELTIHIAKSKTGPRSITIMHSAITWLNTWMMVTKEEQLFDSTLFYQMLKQARRDKVMTIDPTHLRHQFATNEILKGHSPYLIAKHMGNSPSQIEKTYDQVINSMIGREFAKKKLVYAEDGTITITERLKESLEKP